MKKRVARSEVYFYIERLKRRGFIIKSSSFNKGLRTVVLTKEEETKTLKYTTNGWLSIN